MLYKGMFMVLLMMGLVAGTMPAPSKPAPPLIIEFREATPEENLLHDLIQERDMRNGDMIGVPVEVVP